jgi:hypothetical protein
MTTIADVVFARAAGTRYQCGTPEEELLFASFCLENHHLSYAQRLQDLWVLYEFDGMRDGFFVDFGAGNGRDSSNSYILHKRYRWKGILVEPNTDYEDNLRHHVSPGVKYHTGVCIASKNESAVDFLVLSDHFNPSLHG